MFNAVHDLVLRDEHRQRSRGVVPDVTADHRPADDAALMPTFTRVRAGPRPRPRRTAGDAEDADQRGGTVWILLPALALIEREARGATGHLDVGASGGLNLLLDQYEYHYGDKAADSRRTHVVGGPSDVVLPVTTRGPVPVPAKMPAIGPRSASTATRSTSPIPSLRDGSRRASGRTRPTGSIASGPRSGWPPRSTVRRGDAVGSLDGGIAEVGTDAHPVVTNSWVLNYLTPSDRLAYVAELDRIGAERDLSWVFAEAPEPCSNCPSRSGNFAAT